MEVPENLDPSELWHIRESLEKYTMATSDGGVVGGMDLRKIPTLAEGEVDDEVDNSVGRSARITWVAEDGAIPYWSAPFENYPFQLLSVPFPGSHPFDFSLVVKNNFDGTVHSLEYQVCDERRVPCWAHISTFSALAFVLASKRDTRFTYHFRNAVFAFESGIRDRGGNVYLYRAAALTDTWAKQVIIKVGGPLLGVGVIQIGVKPLIICLTEEELVVIQNFSKVLPEK